MCVENTSFQIELDDAGMSFVFTNLGLASFVGLPCLKNFDTRKKPYNRHVHCSIAEQHQLITTENQHEAATATVSLTTTNKAITDWLVHQYGLKDRRSVSIPVNKAQEALQTYDVSRTCLNLESDVLPKLEVLEGLSPGLGWKVFCRYPTEFIHPYATEYWGIMAAYLYTTGFSPGRIEQMFGRHISLFARIVQDPENLRRLFDWMKSLGLNSSSIARLIDKHPLLIQADLESVLKPRIAYMQQLGIPLTGVLSALHRVPELLGVDSSVLQESVDFLLSLGLSEDQVAKLFASQPAVFVCSVEAKLQPAVDQIQTELKCSGALLIKVIAQSGLLSRSLETIKSRAAFWREELGLGEEGLLQALSRFPRLLLYPMDELKYRKKIDFLKAELGRDPAKELTQMPQYISYSLDKRIAPRAAAVKSLLGQELILQRLPKSDAAFCKAYKLDVQEFAAFVNAWNTSEEATKWRV